MVGVATFFFSSQRPLYERKEKFVYGWPKLELGDEYVWNPNRWAFGNNTIHVYSVYKSLLSRLFRSAGLLLEQRSLQHSQAHHQTSTPAAISYYIITHSWFLRCTRRETCTIIVLVFISHRRHDRGRKTIEVHKGQGFHKPIQYQI